MILKQPQGKGKVSTYLKKYLHCTWKKIMIFSLIKVCWSQDHCVSCNGNLQLTCKLQEQMKGQKVSCLALPSPPVERKSIHGKDMGRSRIHSQSCVVIKSLSKSSQLKYGIQPLCFYYYYYFNNILSCNHNPGKERKNQILLAK